MAKGGSKSSRDFQVMPEDAPVNIGVLLESPQVASQRVLGMQKKLHRWAVVDPDRRFDDLYNLVYDPAFLVAAWTRVKGNTGGRSAGVDGRTVAAIERSDLGVAGFLAQLQDAVRSRQFAPMPVRERLIPKPGGKRRRLGIPTVADRVVQAALKSVLEPIFETDFQPVSYGFRPARRAQDAVEEIRFYAHRGYEWVLEGDIRACFDEIDHVALLDRARRRIKDKRVLALVKSFLKAGILTELGQNTDTHSGTPQGGILSPLLATIALSALDDHFQRHWDEHQNATDRLRHRQRGGATYRLIRYADDFVVLVNGGQQHLDQTRADTAAVLATMGLALAPEKTRSCHIDEGFDFLGFHIQRHTQKGSSRQFVYSYPSKKALAAIRRKVKQLTRGVTHQAADQLFDRLNRMIRGWAQYFRHGSSSAAYHNLHSYTWWRIWYWLRKKHPRTPGRTIIGRYYNGWTPEYNGVQLYSPTTMMIERYRYRGTRIHTPWNKPAAAPT
jgi:RNA-directed DNA polymerase